MDGRCPPRGAGRRVQVLRIRLSLSGAADLAAPVFFCIHPRLRGVPPAFPGSAGFLAGGSNPSERATYYGGCIEDSNPEPAPTSRRKSPTLRRVKAGEAAAVADGVIAEAQAFLAPQAAYLPRGKGTCTRGGTCHQGKVHTARGFGRAAAGGGEAPSVNGTRCARKRSRSRGDAYVAGRG